MAQLMGGGPKGGPTNDMNSMLTGLGMSGMVGQDQQGMQQSGLQGMLAGIGQGLMGAEGGAGGTLAGLTQGLAQGTQMRDANMFRYAADPSRQAAAQQAISQIPNGIVAPSLLQQPAGQPPQAMSGGGAASGGGFAGAGLGGRPGGGNSIMDLLRQMSAGGPMGF